MSSRTPGFKISQHIITDATRRDSDELAVKDAVEKMSIDLHEAMTGYASGKGTRIHISISVEPS